MQDRQSTPPSHRDVLPVSGRPAPKRYHVYILTNHSRMLYVGMTDDIHRRTLEHKVGFHEDSFTWKYKLNQLVYYEEATDIDRALSREKQLKGWSRMKKIGLIELVNPHWADLSDRWYTSRQLAPIPSAAGKKWDLTIDHHA